MNMAGGFYNEIINEEMQMTLLAILKIASELIV